MNREIKFRAWLKKHLKVVDVIRIDFEAQEITYQEIDFEYEDVIREKTALFKDISLLQYTGLKDKNGAEIYQGDIVKTVGYHHSTPHEIEETLFVVVWSFTHWVLQKKLKTGGVEETLLGDEDDEVIGNIYENKELLTA